MKIGIISDTHDNIEDLQKAIKIFNEQVKVVVHCGDWCSPFMFIPWKQFKGKTYWVFGNNDADIYRFIKLKEKFGIDIEYSDDAMILELDGKKIAVYHGTSPEITDALVKSGDYDGVFTGHNHTKMVETVGKTLHVNPGTLSHFIGGKNAIESTIAIYNTETNTSEHIELK